MWTVIQMLAHDHPQKDGNVQTQAAAVVLKALAQSLIMVGVDAGLCV